MIASLPLTLNEYAQWALSLWLPSTSKTVPISHDVVDQAVTGMGLSGEALETLEAACQDHPLDLDHLRKELGDTLYYWCVACLRAGLTPSDVWPSDIDFSQVQSGTRSPHDVERAAIHLAIASGPCSEAFKKMVRDGADAEQLRSALPKMGLALARMCEASKFSPIEVALANRAKLLSRQARGTLRGDGNDR